LAVTSTRLLDYLPRGNLLAGSAWRKRHNLVLWVSGLLAPALFVFALWLWRRPPSTLSGLLPLAGCTAMGAVFACVGLALFRRSTEDEQRNSVRLAAQLASTQVHL
jgi:hypothetical protein